MKFSHFLHFFISGEEPAAIQSSSSSRLISFSKSYTEKTYSQLRVVASCKTYYIQLSLLVFIVCLSYKACLMLQMSLPTKKLLSTITTYESLQLSEQKQNDTRVTKCISSKKTRSLQNCILAADAFNSSCHTESS